MGRRGTSVPRRPGSASIFGLPVAPAAAGVRGNPYRVTMAISTRRFRALFSFVSFGTSGWSSP